MNSKNEWIVCFSNFLFVWVCEKEMENGWREWLCCWRGLPRRSSTLGDEVEDLLLVAAVRDLPFLFNYILDDSFRNVEEVLEFISFLQPLNDRREILGLRFLRNTCLVEEGDGFALEG